MNKLDLFQGHKFGLTILNQFIHHMNGTGQAATHRNAQHIENRRSCFQSNEDLEQESQH